LARQVIRDERHDILGYMEETPSTGRVKLMDRSFRTLGWYLPDRDVTTDATWRVIARGGNQLLRLLPRREK
jgi:hypothetical protein